MVLLLEHGLLIKLITKTEILIRTWQRKKVIEVIDTEKMAEFFVPTTKTWPCCKKLFSNNSKEQTNTHLTRL